MKKEPLSICNKLALLVMIAFMGFATPMFASDPRVKPRVIATTDGEVDDKSSMIRFLMYACDFDIVGIVQVNSKYQQSGHSGEKWIEAQLDKYEALLPNLRKHNPSYPDASYLRGLIRVGNENKADLNIAPPNMATKNTAGAQLIIDKLLDNDPRPVHVLSWGGANTTASALWKLKTSYTTEQFNYAVSRIRIYCIWYQDGGGQWIEDNIKGAYINEAYRWDNVWDYQSVTGVSPDDVKAYMTSGWLNTNVKTGHGALGAMTPQSFVSEGDTPSFLHLVNNGLEAHTDYTLGGWGGRSIVDPSDPVNKPNHLTDATITDDGNRNKMYWRWVIDAQNDFAARMDWCVATSFSGANHAPVAQVVGSNTRTVAAGQTVTLDATPTTDPDGNNLTYSWWQYYDADNAAAKVTINNSSSKSASFIIPNEPGKQVHIILEVKDNGSPTLKSYQRIIFNIQSGGVNIPPTVELTSPANNASFVAPASVTINASASDSDGSVASVQFYQGSTLLGTDNTSPYSFTWSNVAAGSYSITANATDNDGASATSSQVTISVTTSGGNNSPTVSVTSPANNASFVAPASVTINASASDSDGSVASVQFYQESTLLGTDNTSPYSFTWSNVAAGSYSITSRATDNGGLSTTSAPVSITVTGTGGNSTITIQENQTGLCSFNGTVDNNNAGFTGVGFINTTNSNNQGITWSVNVPAAGTFMLVWRYADGKTTNRTAQLMVDGVVVTSALSFPVTGSWTTWVPSPGTNVTLAAGNRKIRLQATTAEGLANIDYVSVTGASPAAVACTGQQRVELTPETTADNEVVTGFSVYPNPASDRINIRLNSEFAKGASIQLLDNTGRILVNNQAKGTNHNLEIGKLPSGFYMVKVSNSNKSKVKRIFKK